MNLIFNKLAASQIPMDLLNLDVNMQSFPRILQNWSDRLHVNYRHNIEELSLKTIHPTVILFFKHDGFG